MPQLPFVETVPIALCQRIAPPSPTAYTLPASVAAKTTSPCVDVRAASGDATIAPESDVFHAVAKPFTCASKSGASVKPVICASWPNEVHDASISGLAPTVDAAAS